jgi:predicted nucleotidyltransferase
MLSDHDRETARQLRTRLAAEAPVRDLLVFGSRARGDAAEDSDLDVFIELEDVTPSFRRRISDIAWEVGFARDRVISTIVATREQLAGALGASPLLRDIRQHGVRP